ncbi:MULTISPECIES: M23 family metallopeptidase [unclassified Paenibacillus]|uniref:murein hydrolase activator EnvC family protein n=1 Tax=unclassified Paenibacillus TaxID=185978 RepID=UPI001AE5C933|nr:MULTISPECIES: M23 family metallopeptidase [unclassified Paenibacillus]MBP1157769.1 murein DD-endopeptidase MepM/ murein hydrolase activator NlpD [Paenibacillus sp. PvP091]MBP1171495.1 murein DD-endopeptidase MepM/ murein hydrolase activator NlpD [Paenibacillus sp. PvR098]MBP2442523.1 murein DD-endopeptidase MepM/ murein hydrolase activator NlpD [Paenibacillus sp. PvP052]
MKKSLLPLVAAAGLLGTLLVPQSSFALKESQRIQQELNQLKKAKSAVQQKSAQTDKQIAQVHHEMQLTERDIDVILSEIDATNKRLSVLKDQEDKVVASLEDNAVQLDEAEERITSRDEMLKSRLRLMYMNGAVSYADVLLSSTNFSDFLDRLNALKSIVNQDKEILEANKRDRDLVVEKRVVIEKQFAEVTSLIEQSSVIKAELVVKEKEKQVKIASLSEKERELEIVSEEEEQQMLKIARDEAAKQRSFQQAKQQEQAQARAALAGKKGQSSAPAYTYSGGKFAYPLPSVVRMSSDFGTRTDPFTGRKSSHSGLDFPAPAGTSILAAEAGVVILAGWWSGYGNTVIIDHGKGIWTLYGHIRNDGIVVKKGDSVKRGQKVAEVGSTGRSTGNHLHFEVRINESTVDPKPYLR